MWSNFCLIKKAAVNNNDAIIVTQNPVITDLHGVSTEEYLKPQKIVFSPEMLFMTCHQLSVFSKLFLSPCTSLLPELFELSLLTGKVVSYCAIVHCLAKQLPLHATRLNSAFSCSLSRHNLHVEPLQHWNRLFGTTGTHEKNQRLNCLPQGLCFMALHIILAKLLTGKYLWAFKIPLTSFLKNKLTRTHDLSLQCKALHFKIQPTNIIRSYFFQVGYAISWELSIYLIRRVCIHHLVYSGASLRLSRSSLGSCFKNACIWLRILDICSFGRILAQENIL